MTPYADTSFLGALYQFQKEPRFTEAASWMRLNNCPLVYSRLNELELMTSLHRRDLLSGKKNEIPKDVLMRARLAFADHKAKGILVPRNVSLEEIYDEADEVLKKYAVGIHARSLDVLHLATAILVGADTLLTFDGALHDMALRANLTVPFPKNPPTN